MKALKKYIFCYQFIVAAVFSITSAMAAGDDSGNLSINNADAFGLTPLMQAVSNDNDAVVLLLLKNQADPNMQDQGGETALHMAVRKNNITILKALLKHKPDLNMRDSEGWTPLMRAVAAKNVDIVRELIKSHPKIIIHSFKGESALTMAVLQRNTPITKMLLNAIINQSDYNHSTITEVETALLLAQRTMQNDVVGHLKASLQTVKLGTNARQYASGKGGSSMPPIPHIAALEEAYSSEMVLPDVSYLEQRIASAETVSLANTTISLPGLPWQNKNQVEGATDDAFHKIVDLEKGEMIAFEEQYYRIPKVVPLVEARGAGRRDVSAWQNNQQLGASQPSELALPSAVISEPLGVQKLSLVTQENENTTIPGIPGNTQERPSYERFMEESKLRLPSLKGVSKAVLVPDNATKKAKENTAMRDAQNPAAALGAYPSEMQKARPAPFDKPAINKNYYYIAPFYSKKLAEEYWDRMFAFDENYQDIAAKTNATLDVFELVVGPLKSPKALANMCQNVQKNNLQCLDYNHNSIELSEVKNDASDEVGMTKSQNTAKNDYWIELGAFSSRNEAEYYWMFVQEEHGDLTGRLPIDIQPIKNHALGEQATSIRAGSYDSYGEAQNICAVLRPRNIACFVPSQ
jgi:hypothetical protein